MFGIIIAIIAVVVTVALAVAAIYYGGSEFSDSEARSQAATYQAQADQISGAILLYENANSGAVPPSISALAPEYLDNIPPGNWTVNGSFVTQAGISANSCAAADSSVGITSVPSCSESNLAPTTPCCSN